jgi:hypothetical protein
MTSKIADELKYLGNVTQNMRDYGSTLDCLQKISRYFHGYRFIVVFFDIRRVPYENLLQLENRILLPIVVDSKGIIRLKLLELKLKGC